MTTTHHIDWRSGAVRIEQVRIEVDASGALAPDARALCGRPEITPGGARRDRVGKPLGLHGYAANCVIDVADARVASVAVLFEPIHFFDASITGRARIRPAPRRSRSPGAGPGSATIRARQTRA
ncbi:hypothetical protein [Burkholderia gladioli]|uniref:hypothetical protein n=1 Tax=Burkholderia gladioli TaxID=28095 RepID=UPI001FC89FAE|nr:hypothetical protein [Burkholderia gladioli]